jgi:hypothetical protein
MSLEGWKAFFEVGGVILLFLTFVFGAGALITSNRINAVQDERLREFDKQLTDAQNALTAQKERAANADARVAGLEAEAANAKAAQQGVQLELAKQQEKTATAERALLELQERVQPRHLTTKQKTDIKIALESSPPQNVGVQVFIGTPDGIPFSIEIIEAINSAGWTATHKGQSALGGQIRGLALLMADTKHPPPGAKALQDALKSAGMDAPGYNDQTLKATDLVVFIAPKE